MARGSIGRDVSNDLSPERKKEFGLGGLFLCVTRRLGAQSLWTESCLLAHFNSFKVP